MWTISGPFDGARDDLKGKKTKLLKAGKTYSLGRRACPLLINHKRVSGNHCEFLVGDFPVEMLKDPTFVPTLEVYNTRSKAMNLTRRGEDSSTDIEGQSTMVLQHGDEVYLNAEVSVILEWKPVCCQVPLLSTNPPLALKDCAQLGIHIVQVSSMEASHYVVPSLTLNLSTTSALLGAQAFVAPAWLSEVVRLGNFPKGNLVSEGVALEDNFELPAEANYRPPFDPALAASIKKARIWERDEGRLGMLRGFRFICVDANGNEDDDDLRSLFVSGGAYYEAFNAKLGVVRWRKFLAKGDTRAQTFAVADEEAVKLSVGQEEWSDFKEEASTKGVKVIQVSAIMEAVAYTDVSLLTRLAHGGVTNYDAESPLPDFVPNTHPEEPSYPEDSEPPSQPTRNVSLRRVAHRSNPQRLPSASPPRREPSAPPEELVVPSRKPLVRRAKATQQPHFLGLDDPSKLDVNSTDDTRDKSPSKPLSTAKIAVVPPTPSRPSRLKRRAGTVQASSLFPELDAMEEVKEPPHKKFKALFDASNPDRLLAESQLPESVLALGGNLSENPFLNVGRNVSAVSATQTQSLAEERPMSHPPLTAIREEEEESALTSSTQTTLKLGKRTRGEEDVLMGDASETKIGSLKRRAIEGINSVEAVTKPPSKSTTAASASPRKAARGATVDAPDKDSSFLKAAASRKRGKKKEDEFDREFNNLRISKPDLVDDAREHEYAVLADFGDDTGIRGNFMTVIEMEVFKKDDGAPAGRIRGAERAEWEGRQNFKKFRKKVAGDRHVPVDLTVVEQEDEDAELAGLIRSTPSQNDFSAVHSQASTPVPEPPKPKARKKQPSYAEISDEEDPVAETPAPAPTRSTSRSKPPSRAGSAAPVVRSQRPRRAVRNTQPLFLDSDSDDDAAAKGTFDDDESEDFATAMDVISEGEEDELDSSTLPTRSSRSSNTQPRARAAPGPSRRSATPQVKAAAKPPARSKKTPVVVDDDSDDGATFKGFSRARR